MSIKSWHNRISSRLTMACDKHKSMCQVLTIPICKIIGGDRITIYHSAIVLGVMC